MKKCLHQWAWIFVVDCSDLICKKCNKDVFDIYRKDKAIKLIKLNENTV